MPFVEQTDLDRLVNAVSAELKDGWVKWPGGYPKEIELALIDAVFSIQARYGKAATETTPASGVHAVVARWRNYRGVTADDLSAITELDEKRFLGICANDTRTAGRTKASAVQDAARGLLEVGVRSSVDFASRQVEAKRAYVSVHGLAGVTYSYLRMLLGLHDVKADTWITRFVSGALGRSIGPAETSELMHEAAAVFADLKGTTMPTTILNLDHAIWYSQSQQREARAIRGK